MNYKQIYTNFSDLLISFVNKSMGGDADPFADLPPFVFPMIGGAIIFLPPCGSSPFSGRSPSNAGSESSGENRADKKFKNTEEVRKKSAPLVFYARIWYTVRE